MNSRDDLETKLNYIGSSFIDISNLSDISSTLEVLKDKSLLFSPPVELLDLGQR